MRRVDAATGLISTVIGSGQPGTLRSGPALQATFSEKAPRDVQCSADGRHLFVCDGGSHVIARLEHATGRLEVVAGCGAAGFAGVSSQPHAESASVGLLTSLRDLA